jgi:hypothetical protein
MIATMLLASTIASTQSNSPVINPASFYGAKTYTKNAEFGFLPDLYHAAFAPENPENLTMHILDKSNQELVSGGFYATQTNYPNFQVLRFAPMPTIQIPQPGAYTAEFRMGGSPISRFPFEISRAATGDEFNPTFHWDFKTPVDRMGYIYFDNTTSDATVYAAAWFAPRREGIPEKASGTVTLLHNGKSIANAQGLAFHEPENMRRVFRFNNTVKNAKFTKTDLLKSTGTVSLEIKVGSKLIRKFNWTIADGKIKPLPRTESTFSPRTDYWIPRILGGREEGYSNWTLLDQYWSTSNP